MIGDALKNMVPKPLKRLLKQALQSAGDSLRYRLARQPVDSGSRRHVIFVCKGNICRSAFAEYYLKQELPGGRHRIESCGLDVEQGLFSPHEALCVAKEFELDLESHRSKGLASCNLHDADLILPMEFRQYLLLRGMFPGKQSKIRLLRDFAPWPDRLLCNIYDPYGAGEDEYRRCFKRIQRAVDGLKSQMAIEENA